MNGQSPFQPRVLAALGAALAALFAASVLLTGAGGKRVTGDPVGANSYSRSAVGHLGFFEVLQKLGYRAVRGEQNVLARLGTNGILILAEPDSSGGWSNGSLLGAEKILVVLPKWNATPSKERDGWIGAAKLVPELVARSAFFAVAGAGDVARVAEPSGLRKNLPVPDPTVSGPMQLIKNSKLRPIVATAEGILLGEFREGPRTIWVLADPDPIENHAIGKGDNVAFANAIFTAMLAGRAGTLVFDETLHGFQRPAASALKFLFEFPFNLIALQVMAGVALLLMASVGRFGTPEIPERVLNTGKRDLISSAASLIDHAGHHAAILTRYISMMLQDIGRLLRAPRQLSEAELAAWLDRAAERRGLRSGGRDPPRRVATAKSGDLASLLAQARAIHLWRKDILNGISGRLGDH
jgi:hypothetical protein